MGPWQAVPSLNLGKPSPDWCVGMVSNPPLVWSLVSNPLSVPVEGDEPSPVGDWSSEVVEEERRQSGYLTDSVLSGRGRGYRRGGRGRGRGMGGAYPNRDSGECFACACLRAVRLGSGHLFA